MMELFRKKPLKNRTQQGSTIAEFAPAIFIIFLLTFFPLINLMGVAIGAATVVLLTNDAVANAASQANYSSSLSAMYQAAENDLASGFAAFARVVPMGGYQACGVDLYVQKTVIATDSTSFSAPNQSVPAPIDTTGSIYEFAAISDYNVGPFISMQAVPLLSSIPGLGQPFRITFRATRLTEHPQGLASSPIAYAGVGNGAVTSFVRTSASTTQTPNNPAGAWRTPNIYNLITAAGETIVTQNVILVPANAPWVSSGITFVQGEQIWIDTTAVGTWTASTTDGYPYVDANGYGQVGWGSYSSTAPSSDALIGCVGPTPAASTWTVPPPDNPSIFMVGDQLLNYQLQGNGPLTFQINDSATPGLADNSGAQLVRIIITK